jgi:hypothetical protein
MVMTIFQIINQVIETIFTFNKNMGLDKIANQSKGSFNVTRLFEILIGIANALGCSHIINVRGFECLI